MVRTEPTTTGTAGVDTSLDYINYAGNVTNSTLYLGKSWHGSKNFEWQIIPSRAFATVGKINTTLHQKWDIC